MKIDTIVTLGDNSKYYLTDKTEFNDKNYFIGTKLDELNNALMESDIFEETNKNEDTYLVKVEDKDLYDYLASIFTANFNEAIDDMEEA